jgi:hypothetical protein
MNLDDALTDLELLGCSVENVNRTGEIRVRHPRLRAPLVVNGSRGRSGYVASGSAVAFA